MIEILPRSGYRRARWRNGAGFGWEIVAGPREAVDPAMPFEWRLAISEIERDADFSDYPGIERAITLLEGNGFDLEIDGYPGVRAREPWVPHRFPGDRPTLCRLVEGRCVVLNLMADRRLWSAEVAIGHPAAVTSAPLAKGAVALAFMLSGTVGLSGATGGLRLGAHDTALWTSDDGAPSFQAEGAAKLYIARLTPAAAT